MLKDTSYRGVIAGRDRITTRLWEEAIIYSAAGRKVEYH